MAINIPCIPKPSKWFSRKSLGSKSSSKYRPTPPESDDQYPSPKNPNPRKKDDFQQVFCFFDVDGDGKISANELVAYFLSIGESMSVDEAKRAISEFDSDGDNLLEVGDFVRLVEERDENGDDVIISTDDDDDDHHHHLRRAFEMFEVDVGCGCITPRGLQLVLNKLGDGKSVEECEAMIRVFDLDEGELQEDILVEIASFQQVLVFSFKELKKATNSFSSRSKVRNYVYRGVFGEQILAIKKMSLDVSKEVNMLNKIYHLNLIKLHGMCKNHDCFYLVYEYMKNGSLREWLCKERSKESDSCWIKRIQIALDVANGLHYLHNFNKPANVHMDIKSSNIRAKISNVSHARTAMKGTKGSVLTTRVLGTRGYMAPEYMETGLMTTSIDVYAFGVVMLELTAGKDAVVIQEGREVLLSAAIASAAGGENAEIELSYFIDPMLTENGGMEYALRVIKLSLACLRRDPVSRPGMSEVESSLVKIQVDLQSSQLFCRMLEENRSNFL